MGIVGLQSGDLVSLSDLVDEKHQTREDEQCTISLRPHRIRLQPDRVLPVGYPPLLSHPRESRIENYRTRNGIGIGSVSIYLKRRGPIRCMFYYQLSWSRLLDFEGVDVGAEPIKHLVSMVLRTVPLGNILRRT